MKSTKRGKVVSYNKWGYIIGFAVRLELDNGKGIYVTK